MKTFDLGTIAAVFFGLLVLSGAFPNDTNHGTGERGGWMADE